MKKSELTICLDYINKALAAESCTATLDEFKAWLLSGTKETVKTARKPRTKGFNIYRCVSTDKTRYFMTGIYHDSEAGLAVATDGRILIQIRSAYNPEHAGEIMLEDGRKVEGRFPNWRRVTPDKKDMEERSVDWTDVRSTLDSAKPYIAALKRCRYTKEHREPSIMMDGRRIAYEYAVMACDFMEVYQDAKFYVHTSESRVYGAPVHQSVVLVSGDWEKPEAMLIIMPMTPIEEGDKDYMEKEGLIWTKPLLNKYDLSHYIHHKDWDKRLQQGIKTEQDEKDETTIKTVAEFFGIPL